MQVRMRFAWRIIKPMDVLVVRVVHMRMTVLKRLMDVFVVMVLGQVQPHAHAHQASGDRKLPCDGIMQKKYGRDGADEGSRREIGAGPGCAQFP